MRAQLRILGTWALPASEATLGHTKGDEGNAAAPVIRVTDFSFDKYDPERHLAARQYQVTPYNPRLISPHVLISSPSFLLCVTDLSPAMLLLTFYSSSPMKRRPSKI